MKWTNTIPNETGFYFYKPNPVITTVVHVTVNGEGGNAQISGAACTGEYYPDIKTMTGQWSEKITEPEE